MVKKQPIRLRIKTVISALREGKKTWSELKALGVPEKTLERILKDYLMFWGLVRKDGEYYVWFENFRLFESKYDYELAVEHSRKLIPALKKIIDVAPLDPKLYRAAKEHLKTGYPEIYHKLEKVEAIYTSRFRYLFGKYKGRILTPDKFWILEPVKVKKGRFFSNVEFRRVPVPFIIEADKDAKPEELKEIEELRDLLCGIITSPEALNIHKELAGDISLLILKVEMGEPLDGRCFLCPRIRIKERAEP